MDASLCDTDKGWAELWELWNERTRNGNLTDESLRQGSFNREKSLVKTEIIHVDEKNRSAEEQNME